MGRLGQLSRDNIGHLIDTEARVPPGQQVIWYGHRRIERCQKSLREKDGSARTASIAGAQMYHSASKQLQAGAGLSTHIGQTDGISQKLSNDPHLVICFDYVQQILAKHLSAIQQA